jgi:hypothetical protein
MLNICLNITLKFFWLTVSVERDFFDSHQNHHRYANLSPKLSSNIFRFRPQEKSCLSRDLKNRFCLFSMSALIGIIWSRVERGSDVKASTLRRVHSLPFKISCFCFGISQHPSRKTEKEKRFSSENKQSFSSNIIGY